MKFGKVIGAGTANLKEFVESSKAAKKAAVDRHVQNRDWEQLVGFADSDYGGDTDTRRSMRGYAVYYNGDLIVTKAKLDTVVSLSSGEAEVSALVLCVQEVNWLRGLLQELGDEEVGEYPSVIFEDNQAACAMVENPNKLHTRTKHIAIRKHWVADQVVGGEVRIVWIGTDVQIADIFTKSLSKGKFEVFRNFIVVKLSVVEDGVKDTKVEGSAQCVCTCDKCNGR